MNPIHLFTFIGYGLIITYYIFMIIYLSNAQKCDKYMNKTDQNFRKAALVITWISVIISGLILFGLIIFKYNESYNYYTF